MFVSAEDMLDRQCQRLDCRKCSRRQWKWWIGNVKDWTAGSARTGKGNAGQTMSKTGLPEVLATAYHRIDWKSLSAESSLVSP